MDVYFEVTSKIKEHKKDIKKRKKTKLTVMEEFCTPLEQITLKIRGKKSQNNFTVLVCCSIYYLQQVHLPLFSATPVNNFNILLTLQKIREIYIFIPLREKCPNTGFSWSVFSCIRTEYRGILLISVFSPNAGKYRPEKSPYLDTLYTVILTS